MLIWLLSQSLVVELRVYYRLVANTEIKWKAAQSDPTTAPKLQSRVSSDADSFINQTRSLSLTDSPTSSHFLSTPLESPARPSAFTQRHSSVASGVSESHSNAGTSPVPIPGQAPQQLSGTSGMSGLITGASSFRSQDAPNPGDLALNEASVIAEPGEANSVERKWLEKMVEGKDPEIVGGFQKSVLRVIYDPILLLKMLISLALKFKGSCLSSTASTIGRKFCSEAVSHADRRRGCSRKSQNISLFFTYKLIEHVDTGNDIPY